MEAWVAWRRERSDPGSSSTGLRVVCEKSCLVVLSCSSTVFLPPQKLNSKFQLEFQLDEEPLCANATAKSYLFFIFI